MTAAELSQAGWVLDLSEGDLEREVGVLSVARAKVYAAEGRVQTLVAGGGGRQLLSTVSGAERTRYQTVVSLVDEDGPEWVARCSCPVRMQCKHAVATIISAQLRLREAGETGRNDWESLFAPLVQLSAPSPRLTTALARERWRLGLQVALQAGIGGREESTRVTLVPVREGTGRPWVRQGVSWRDLAASSRVQEIDPGHRAALMPLWTISQGSMRYHARGPELLLGDLGQLVWPTLTGVLRSGVPLVPGKGMEQVELGDGEVDVVLDLARVDDDGLRVSAAVQLADGSPVDGEKFFVVGRPGHGVGRLTDAGELTLWPLAHEPAPLIVQLLERADPVEVPAADAARFLGHYYPSLTRSVPVVSRDGSVPTTGAGGPVLRLRVTPGEGHALSLAWSFGYPVPSADGPGEVVEVQLEHRGDDPPRDLGAEARLMAAVVPLLDPCPELLEAASRGVSRMRPEVELAARRTIAFSTLVLPALREAPEVDVVVDGELPTYEEADEAPVVTLETSEGAVDDWFDLHVTVTVAGQTVPFEELFAALARGDEVMMLNSGTWFNLDVPELHTLRRLIEEARQMEDHPRREGSVGLRLTQAGLWEELLDVGVVGHQSRAWRASIEALLELGDAAAGVGADIGRAKVPEQLQAELRPYQMDGFDWLSRLWDHRLGGVLADDMGLGKTLQTLTLIARAEERGDLAEGPVLVVAPASVVPVWAAEAARFTPGLRVATITASSKRRGTELAAEVAAADVVVTSYTLLRIDGTDFRDLPWSALVLDEAQAVKNPHSKTYRAAQAIGAVRTFVLTGTPLENSLLDLWSMFSLAAPGLFGSSDFFNQGYRKAIEHGEEEIRTQWLSRLRRRIRPFMLRRTKGEVASDLPQKTEQVLSVPLAREHQRIYDRHLQRERQRVLGLLKDMDKNRVLIFRALTVLRQLALDPGLVEEEHVGLATSAKISVLLEHVSELAAEGHRALVFSSFTSYLALVREALEARGISYSYLDGSTSNRAARIEGFRQGDDEVFLISLKAGGVGLTLTEADYVFILDPWWNPAAEAQAVDRTHRIGQTRPVNVYRLVSTGTIEEKVVGLQERKRQLFTTVVDAGEYRSGRISAADIRGLLADD